MIHTLKPTMISLNSSNYSSSVSSASAGVPEAGSSTNTTIAHSNLSPTSTLSPSALPVTTTQGCGLSGLSQAAASSTSMNTNNPSHSPSISSSNNINAISRHSISSNSSNSHNDSHIGLSNSGNNSGFTHNPNRSSNSSEFVSANKKASPNNLLLFIKSELPLLEFLFSFFFLVLFKNAPRVLRRVADSTLGHRHLNSNDVCILIRVFSSRLTRSTLARCHRRRSLTFIQRSSSRHLGSTRSHSRYRSTRRWQTQAHPLPLPVAP